MSSCRCLVDTIFCDQVFFTNYNAFKETDGWFLAVRLSMFVCLSFLSVPLLFFKLVCSCLAVNLCLGLLWYFMLVSLDFVLRLCIFATDVKFITSYIVESSLCNWVQPLETWFCLVHYFVGLWDIMLVGGLVSFVTRFVFYDMCCIVEAELFFQFSIKIKSCNFFMSLTPTLTGLHGLCGQRGS